MNQGEKRQEVRGWARDAGVTVGVAARTAWALGLLAVAGCSAGSSDSVQPTLALFPDEAFVIAGPEGGPYFPQSKTYLLSNAGEEPLEWSARTSHPSIAILPPAGTLDAGESVIATTSVSVVNGLPPGQYEARLIFRNESTGTEQEQSALLLISGSGTLLVSPTIGFSSSGPVGGPFAPLSQGYVLTNDSTESIDWAITSSQPWLSVDISSGQLASAASLGVELAIDPVQAAQLGAATHVANVLFRDLTNEVDFAILVELVVIEPAAMAVSPSTGFTTAGPPSGPFTPAEKSYTLTNLGSELLTWQVNRSANWITLSRTSGNLAPGQQTSVTIGIDADRTSSLGDGSYAATVGFANTTNGIGNTSRSVDVTLTSPPALLSVTPGQPFTSAGTAGGPFLPASKTYTVTNGGGVTLQWQATASAAWLALAPASGSLAPGASAQVVASIQQGVAANLAVGQYSAQLAFVNLNNGAGNTSLVASLNVSGSGGGSVPVLTPGAGFTGPTQEPGQIGSGTAKAIARWDVVPYQTITAADDPTFTVGVVAFHIAGIARVSFSLEGGPFVDATSMTLNPETGVWEYCATLDARDFATDRPIELRAIAYPNAAAPQAEGTGGYPGGGLPRLLDSLRLYVDAGQANPPIVRYCRPSGSDSSGDGSPGNPYATPYRAAQAIHSDGGGSADGGIVHMGAGSYSWVQSNGGTLPATTHRWLTFSPWPGTPRDQVRITGGGYPGTQINLIRLQGLTLNTYVHGDDGGFGGNDAVWLDGGACIGAGIGTSTHFAGWNPGFKSKYWTDVQVQDDASSVPASVDIARNVDARRVQYGPARPKLVVNCSWDTVNNGGTSNHPDFIHWNFAGSDTTFDNAIVYGVTALNIDALGIFYKDTGHLQNVALVNLAMQLQGSGGSPIGQNCLSLDHFLLTNATCTGPALRWEMPGALMRNMSIRGSHFDAMSINPQTGGDFVSNTWFDQNNFRPASSIKPGTGVSVLDPQFVNVFTPASSSPLRDRMDPLVPVDKDNAVRVSPSTIGAVE